MAVTQTTDAKLLFEVATHERLVLKYHSDACGDPCKELKPLYEELSLDKKYKGIAFYRINADSNPAALKLILARKQPLMTIYHKGILVDCSTVDSKAKMLGFLDKLLSMTSG
jgi:hypothetical protein